MGCGLYSLAPNRGPVGGRRPVGRRRRPQRDDQQRWHADRWLCRGGLRHRYRRRRDTNRFRQRPRERRHVAGGFQFISGGEASNTTVTNNGEVDVFSAGLAFNATAKAGGRFFVQSGGFASSTVVKSGGDETVGAGGTASGVVVSSGGTFEWFGSNPIVASAQFRSGATVAVGSGYVFSGSVSGGITELFFLAARLAVRRSAAPPRLSKGAASPPARQSLRAANRWCWPSVLR